MNRKSSFHIPMPGDIAIFYCLCCKKRFTATIPEEHWFDFFNKTANRKAKCPSCKKLCSLDLGILY